MDRRIGNGWGHASIWNALEFLHAHFLAQLRIRHNDQWLPSHVKSASKLNNCAMCMNFDLGSHWVCCFNLGLHRLDKFFTGRVLCNLLHIFAYLCIMNVVYSRLNSSKLVGTAILSYALHAKQIRRTESASRGGSHLKTGPCFLASTENTSGPCMASRWRWPMSGTGTGPGTCQTFRYGSYK